MSEHAEKLSKLSTSAIINIFILQLSQIFDTDVSNIKDLINTQEVFNWGDQQYIRCGYTFPSVNELDQDSIEIVINSIDEGLSRRIGSGVSETGSMLQQLFGLNPALGGTI